MNETVVLSVAGLSIIDFNSVSAALWVSNGATVTLQDSTITRNTISSKSKNSTLIGVSAVEPSKIYTQEQDTILRLQNVTLTGNLGPPRIITDFSKAGVESAYGAGVFSDEDLFVFFAEAGGGVALGVTSPLEQAPANSPGVNASDPWFVSVQEVRHAVSGSLTTLISLWECSVMHIYVCLWRKRMEGRHSKLIWLYSKLHPKSLEFMRLFHVQVVRPPFMGSFVHI